MTNTGPAADEQQLLHDLIGLMLRSDDWSRYVSSSASAWAIQPGSVIADDNGRTEPHQLGHRAALAITVAVDHLAGLRVMTMGPPGERATALLFRINAPFTMLRAAIENAAAGVWLLATTDPNQRALRAFRLGAKEVKNGEAMKVLLGVTGPRTKEQRLDRIKQRATACGVDPAAAVSSVNYVEIVRDAAAPIGLNPKAAEAQWRVCSALAHGDQWPGLAALETVTELRGTSSVIRGVVADTEALVHATRLAVTLTEAALRLFGEQRRRT